MKKEINKRYNYIGTMKNVIKMNELRLILQVFVEWQKAISGDFFYKLLENLSDLIFFREIVEKFLFMLAIMQR